MVASLAQPAREVWAHLWRTQLLELTLNTVALVAASLMFAPVARMGLVYVASATVLGALFLSHTVQLRRDHTTKRAMRLFGWSITYVTLLFSAMALDQLLRSL